MLRIGHILAILVIGIFTIGVFSAFSQTQETISVTTSKKTYNEGDTIVIYGQVSSIELDTPVTLQIFHGGSLVDIVQVKVAQDGKFTHTFLAQGSLWQENGTYIVRASYGANSIVETGFEYFTSQSDSEITDIFEVDAGNYGTFDVGYTIRGATVKNIVIDSGMSALVVFIESEDDGYVTLDLPRSGIDSKKSDNIDDDTFIILIDGVEVPYKEISSNTNSRTITIDFEKGDSDIKIIGTVIASSSTQKEYNPELSVKTDKEYYKEGDSIVVSGFIKNLNLDYPVEVNVIVRDPSGNLVAISQFKPKTDGTYQTTLVATGAFKEAGKYTIQVSYSGQKTTTTFNFAGGSGYTPPPPEPTPEPEQTKNVPDFIEPNKGAQYYLDRYYNEPAYKKWFDTNYPDYTIEEAIELAIPGSLSDSESEVNLFDFIDPNKGTQYILDRYYNEPAYKAWFDTNFPGYTIEEAIAIAISGSNSGSVSSIKVTTDSSSYKKGDIIVISGQVENPKDYEVILRITNPGDTPVYQQNLGLKNDGTFGDMVIAGNSIQWTDGTYIVKATHNEASATTNFSFSGSSTSPSTPSPSTTRVSVAQGSSVPGCEETNQCFIPFETRVAVEGEVTWKNDDTAAHTVTSGTPTDGPDGTFDSSLFMAGSSFSHRFDESGTFPYFCMVHPWMIGTVVVGQGGTSPPPPEPSPNISISVDSDHALYDLGDIVNLSIKLAGTSKSQNVAVSVADPTGHAVVSRTLTTDSSGMASTEFGIHENFKTGTYTVAATVSIGGVTYKDTANFKIQSQFNQIKIISVEGTDQQGNSAPFTRGELGFVKVVISANKPIATLATVNLFDSELTTIGIASFRTTLSTGESEMILSFLIPEDAATGSADVYTNAFSDWPSNGGVSLTGEFTTQVRIR